MAQAFVCLDSETVGWREYADAPLTGSQVRVRCDFATEKHGTTLEFFKGHAMSRGVWDVTAGLFRPEQGPPLDYPMALGNMVVGRIEDVGPEAELRSVGDRVYCSAPFRPTVTVNESQCRAIGEEVSWKTAVCFDPLSCALGAVRDGNVRVGDAVAVFGLGAIGLLCVQVARLAGAHPILALDPSAKRREVALATGASEAIDPTATDAGLAIRERTAMRGADVVIEYSGAVEAMQAALRGVAFGGDVVAGAFPPPYKAGLDLGAEAHINRPNLIFSRAVSEPDRDHPRWDVQRNGETCHRLIGSGDIDGELIVDPVIPFDDLPARYLDVVTDKDAAIKLGVTFQ